MEKQGVLDAVDLTDDTLAEQKEESTSPTGTPVTSPKKSIDTTVKPMQSLELLPSDIRWFLDWATRASPEARKTLKVNINANESHSFRHLLRQWRKIMQL